MSVEAALAARRSVRGFTAEPLTLAEVSQLLWAAQGITDAEGHRTAPSAGALYPIEISLVVGSVEGLEPGVYRYRPQWHRLETVAAGDRRRALTAAAGRQSWIGSAPAVLVVAAVFERTAVKYGRRAERYVHIEAGCVAENVLLEAVALGLGSVAVGAFDDRAAAAAAALAGDGVPLLLLPVGRPRGASPPP